MLPHVQLQMMFCREHFIADLALSVLRQTDAFVDVVLQLGEEEEGLVTTPAQKPLGLVGSHVGLQAGLPVIQGNGRFSRSLNRNSESLQ